MGDGWTNILPLWLDCKVDEAWMDELNRGFLVSRRTGFVSTSILTTKLNIPKPRPQVVLRHRLISRLDDGLVQKLTLISAPAGFGKTTLTSEWVRHLDRSVSWLSLDESDNDLIHFLSYFIAALQRLGENIGQDELKRLRSPHPPAIEEILISIINQINALSENVVFILDDYHLISTQAIHEAVTYFLDHMPENMHLVIVSRADPPLPLARLRGRGDVAELRQIDLRFTVDEANDFLQDVMGLGIQAEDVRALNSRTEGWVAGLQMAAVSLQGQEDISNSVRIFTGSNRYILDYLLEEVLQRQPEGIQKFLLQTSILDRLTSSLCDAIFTETGDWGIEVRDRLQSPIINLHSQTILEHLENSNLFIFPLDDHRQWYRYHRLFRDLLRKRLQQFSPDLIPDLHQRACDWFEHTGMLSDAIEHALNAHDFDRAARLMEQVGEEMLMRSEVGTFNRWLQRLPDEILDDWPYLKLFHAWLLILTGASKEEIESHLNDLGEQGGVLSARVAAIRAYLAVYQGDLSSAWELSHVAWEQLPEEDLFLRGILSLIFGISLLAKGDVEAGIESLSNVLQASQEVDNVMVGTITISHLARLRMRAGHLKEAQDIYQRAIDLAKDENGHHLPIAGEAFMGLGEILLQWNDLEKAEEFVLKGIQHTEAWSNVAALEGYLALARIRQAQNRGDEVAPLIEKARELALQFETTTLDDIMVDLYEAKLFLAQGDLEAAIAWIKERNVEDFLDSEQWIEQAGNFHEHLRKYELIILSRILIAKNEPQRALEILIPLLSAMKELHRTDLILEILILQAIAQQAAGDLKEAMRMIKEALSIGEKANYIRIFIDGGSVVAKLIYEASQQGVLPEYCGKLLNAFPDPNQNDLPTGTSEAELIEPLSPRESEVLTLISEGLTNREISERLFLTLGTVKVHTRNIYGKLCVNNRTQAVARARSIGIL
jgi:LuxR family maltose regulon positive regulatory protein